MKRLLYLLGVLLVLFGLQRLVRLVFAFINGSKDYWIMEVMNFRYDQDVHIR